MDLRVLVAFEDDYRAYRDVIAAGIRILRPHVEVETTPLESLGKRIEHFDPQLVVCSQPDTLDLRRRAAWVELPLDSTRPAKICVGGRHSTRMNPALDVLLAVIDEVEELMETPGDLTGC
jgi:hypothetical protein